MKKSNKMLKILLLIFLAIVVIVSIVKFEIALFKFLLVIGMLALVFVAVYM